VSRGEGSEEGVDVTSVVRYINLVEVVIGLVVYVTVSEEGGNGEGWTRNVGKGRVRTHWYLLTN
jgi:hypothetical protein